MVAEREIPAWQCTSTRPPLCFTESVGGQKGGRERDQYTSFFPSVRTFNIKIQRDKSILNNAVIWGNARFNSTRSKEHKAENEFSCAAQFFCFAISWLQIVLKTGLQMDYVVKAAQSNVLCRCTMFHRVTQLHRTNSLRRLGCADVSRRDSPMKAMAVEKQALMSVAKLSSTVSRRYWNSPS